MNGFFSATDVFNQIQQQGEIGRERGERSYLGKLYGQAATAAPEQRSALFALMGKTDPEFARGAENHFAQRDAAQQERMATELRNRASILRNLPPEQRAIGWQRMAPDVAKLTGMPELEQMPYDPATFDPVLDQLAGIGASEPKVLSPGSALYDSSGRMIAQNTYQAPANAQAVRVPDGNGGEVLMLMDPRTRTLMDPFGAGPQAAPDPATYADVQGTLDAIGQKYGFETTSTIRTPEENKAARGVPNSQHLTGTARDFSIRGKSPEQIAAMRAELESAGFEVLVSDHGTGPHMHAELPPGARAGGRMGYNPPKASADGAPSGYRFLPDGTLEPIPGGPSDPSATKPMTAQQRAKMEQTLRKERLMLGGMETNTAETVELIDSILKRRSDFGGVTGIGAAGAKLWGSDWADLAADIDRLRGMSAFAALQEMRANSPTGGALGSITERELTLLQNAETALQNSQSPEQLERNLKDYKRRLQDALRRMREGMDEFYQDVPAGEPAPEPAAGGWGIQRVAP